ncbi:MAG: hypothetical protein K2X77_34210 [Candidatus Obscuribacterales bacterium]|nr:hypothetical protein [Candidatus Obscuribacterales bacterium]
MTNREVCPVGEVAGHDGDGCRVQLCKDNIVVCFACQQAYPADLADRLYHGLRIVTRRFGIPSMKIGSDTAVGTAEYNAACLSGYDPALSTAVRAVFTTKTGKTVTFTWDRENNEQIDKPDANVGMSWQELPAAQSSIIPDDIRQCVVELDALGYRVRHVAPSNGYNARVVMTCGKSIGQMGYVAGVSVELTWTA